MGIYLGNSETLKINLSDVSYILNIFSDEISEEVNILASSDNFILQDIDGMYLSPIISEEGD